jgi:hypothetical protein
VVQSEQSDRNNPQPGRHDDDDNEDDASRNRRARRSTRGQGPVSKRFEIARWSDRKDQGNPKVMTAEAKANEPQAPSVLLQLTATDASRAQGTHPAKAGWPGQANLTRPCSLRKGHSERENLQVGARFARSRIALIGALPESRQRSPVPSKEVTALARFKGGNPGGRTGILDLPGRRVTRRTHRRYIGGGATRRSAQVKAVRRNPDRSRRTRSPGQRQRVMEPETKSL